MENMQNLSCNFDADVENEALIISYSNDEDSPPKYLLRMTAPDTYVATNGDGIPITDEELIAYMHEDIGLFFSDCEFPVKGGLLRIYEHLQKHDLSIAYARVFQHVLDDMYAMTYIQTPAEAFSKETTEKKKKAIILAIRFFADLAESGELPVGHPDEKKDV